jgi:hypothetical protein
VNTGVQCALQTTEKVYDCGGAMRPEFDPSARPSGQSRHLLPTTDRNDRLAATLDNFSTEAFVLVERKFGDDERALREGKRLRTNAGAAV